MHVNNNNTMLQQQPSSPDTDGQKARTTPLPPDQSFLRGSFSAMDSKTPRESNTPEYISLSSSSEEEGDQPTTPTPAPKHPSKASLPATPCPKKHRTRMKPSDRKGSKIAMEPAERDDEQDADSDVIYVRENVVTPRGRRSQRLPGAVGGKCRPSPAGENLPQPGQSWSLELPSEPLQQQQQQQQASTHDFAMQHFTLRGDELGGHSANYTEGVQLPHTVEMLQTEATSLAMSAESSQNASMSFTSLTGEAESPRPSPPSLPSSPSPSSASASASRSASASSPCASHFSDMAGQEVGGRLPRSIWEALEDDMKRHPSADDSEQLWRMGIQLGIGAGVQAFQQVLEEQAGSGETMELCAAGRAAEMVIAGRRGWWPCSRAAAWLGTRQRGL
ncbi:hypothetical protein MN608_09707 [Microdochium nivale]|nr:hypothetical protein MN608_09707 [Microdochium nivale]